jgi:ribA/ribD-fused uncharacterized protein
MTGIADDVRSVDDLLWFIRNGGRPEYLFFWGHQASSAGGAGKGCLSQWWPAELRVDEVVYPTAEHFMMASKALLFGDAQTAEHIRTSPHPNAAKTLGRQVRGFDEQRWTEHRFDIVVAGNYAKFSQHAELLDFLLGTGDQVLVEASPLDGVWGIGLAADDEDAQSPAHWRGQNLLGFALMVVRARIRATAR